MDVDLEVRQLVDAAERAVAEREVYLYNSDIPEIFRVVVSLPSETTYGAYVSKMRAGLFWGHGCWWTGDDRFVSPEEAERLCPGISDVQLEVGPGSFESRELVGHNPVLDGKKWVRGFRGVQNA